MSFPNKNNHNLLELLKTVSLSNSREQLLLDDAINQLTNGGDRLSVIMDLEKNLSSLAIQQNLSAEGVALLAQLQHPDTGHDYARSAMTWF